MFLKDFTQKYDPTYQFGVLKNSYKQIDYALNLGMDTPLVKKKPASVVVSGMGGSAISADLLKNFLSEELNVPYVVNRNYKLPVFADKDTLLIICSYSGNTEETLSVLKEGIRRKCIIIAISTGGEVEDLAERYSITHYALQKGFQPRYSLGQAFFVLLRVLEIFNLVKDQRKVSGQISDLWKTRGEEYSEEGNIAAVYARELIGYIPVILSAADYTDAAGYRFKCQLNENAKTHAFHNVIPELNHNEIIGWETFRQSDFKAKAVNLIDSSYPAQIKARFKITSELITAKETEIINLESDQISFKLRLFDLIFLTDWITYYLAVLRGFDPVEIDYINILKKSLK